MSTPAINCAQCAPGEATDLFGEPIPLCRCGCGRPRANKSLYHLPACRARYSRDKRKIKSRNLRFEEYLDFKFQYPEVYQEYLRVARQLRQEGFRRVRSRMIHEVACFNALKKFKVTVNNNHGPFFLRQMVEEYPGEFRGFFELRG